MVKTHSGTCRSDSLCTGGPSKQVWRDGFGLRGRASPDGEFSVMTTFRSARNMRTNNARLPHWNRRESQDSLSIVIRKIPPVDEPVHTRERYCTSVAEERNATHDETHRDYSPCPPVVALEGDGG